MIKYLIIALSTISLVFGSTKNVISCSSNTGEVKIDPCNSDPCEFKRGSNGVFNVEFTAPADSKTLTAELTVHLGALDIPHPSFDRNACNDYGVDCPLKKGTKYTYKYPMKVLPEYPKIKTVFKFLAKDESGNLAFCFTMPVSVVD